MCAGGGVNGRAVGGAKVEVLIGCCPLQGSLGDFLKGNVLSWSELWHIATSMSCGLNHLHQEELSAKPCIAHR